MATGLAVPVRVNGSGGVMRESGDAHAETILKLALGDDHSENPWQQNIGLGVGMIFDVADPISRPRILARLVALFSRLEQLKRFKLRRNTLYWAEDPENGEMTLQFKYVNLESDEEAQFRRSFRFVGAGESPGSV